MNHTKHSPATTKLMYTVNEAATLLSLSNKTVYRLLKRGLLKSHSAIRHKRITEASIRSFAGAAN